MQRSFRISGNGLVPSDRDFDKIFDPIRDIETEDDDGNLLPGGITKWEKALQSVGLWRVVTYPVDKYGAGCAIFQIDSGGDPVGKGYAYLVCLDLYHNEPILIGLRGAVDFIEFHRIVQPMLMLQTEQRFLDDRDRDDVWDGGTYRKGFESSEAERG